MGFIGDISGTYLQNIIGKFQTLKAFGICGLAGETAKAAAERYDLTHYSDMQALLAAPEIDIVLNITPLSEHYAVTKAALLAGKHVYSEAPLAATLAQGRELVALAQENNLLLCCGPDTFLGAGVQGARRLLEGGIIGTLMGGAAHLLCQGGDSLAAGPHYITALAQIFGPVQSVMAMRKDENGTAIQQYALLRFQSGTIVTLAFACDVYSMPGVSGLAFYGTKGNMILSNPAAFGGELKIKLQEKDSPSAPDNWGHGEWIPIDSPYSAYHENSRGLGLADMAAALAEGRTPRASAALQGLHVLEVLEAMQRSSAEGRAIAIEAPFAAQKPISLAAEEGSTN